MKIEAQQSFDRTPLLLAMMIIATGQVGVSIYLPSLPLISNDLQVDQASVQMLVTLFLIGFGGSQLFYGPLADSVGRRPTFILGQGVYLVGTLICVLFSEHITTLEFGRLLQGLGAGSASVLGRSVLRDSYDGPNLTKALSYLAITASIIPILAPVFGSWVAFHFSWTAVFGFVLLYISAIFIVGYFVLPETLPYAKRPFAPRNILKNYWRLLGNTQVLSSASYNWISYLSSLVTLSVLPFFLQEQLGLSVAEYGSIMIIPSAGLLIGSISVNILRAYFSLRQLLGLAIGIMIFAGIWLLLTPFSVFHLIWSFTWLTIAQGISFPLSTTMLLSPHKDHAGSVSALSGSIQMCLAGILGGYLVEYWIVDMTALGWFYMVTSASMLCVLVITSERRTVHAVTPL